MTCQTVNRKVSAYLDGRLPALESREVALHLAGCAACLRVLDEHSQVRSTLRALPTPNPPPYLTTRLHVLASRERAARAARVSVWAALKSWVEATGFWMNALMRPLAIPCAGGLASALVLFSIFVPTYMRSATPGDDVPTMLTTEATLKSTLSFGLGDEDIVVDVFIDENGRMIDYSIPHEQRWGKDIQLRRNVENTLLCTHFTPATMFGQPASGRTRITLRRSFVDVKG